MYSQLQPILLLKWLENIINVLIHINLKKSNIYLNLYLQIFKAKTCTCKFIINLSTFMNGENLWKCMMSTI